VSDDVTATLRKPLPPHKQKAPVASKRRGRGARGSQAESQALSEAAGQGGVRAGHKRVRWHQRRVPVGSPGAAAMVNLGRRAGV